MSLAGHKLTVKQWYAYLIHYIPSSEVFWVETRDIGGPEWRALIDQVRQADDLIGWSGHEPTMYLPSRMARNLKYVKRMKYGMLVHTWVNKFHLLLRFMK